MKIQDHFSTKTNSLLASSPNRPRTAVKEAKNENYLLSSDPPILSMRVSLDILLKLTHRSIILLL